MSAAPAAVKDDNTEAPQTRVLLLVEDNRGDAALVQDLLSESTRDHYRVIHVERLGDAVSQLQGDSVDVVLLDLRLPDGAGMDTVEAVRLESNVPIVVLTGADDEELALACIDAGADDYLYKAEIAAPTLQRAIGYAITRRREAQIRELEETVARYKQLTVTDTGVTARLAGIGGIHERFPKEYDDLVHEYGGVLERYLDQLVLKRNKPREAMERVITKIGDSGGGPRDLVRLHVDALEVASIGKRAERARSLAVEGRLLALEMMGLLVEYYRVGIRRHLQGPGDDSP